MISLIRRTLFLEKELIVASAFSVTLTGMSSANELRTTGNYNIYYPGKTYGQVETAHALLIHFILDYFLGDF